MRNKVEHYIHVQLATVDRESTTAAAPPADAYRAKKIFHPCSLAHSSTLSVFFGSLADLAEDIVPDRQPPFRVPFVSSMDKIPQT